MCVIHKWLRARKEIVLYLTSKTSGTDIFIFCCLVFPLATAWESIKPIVGVAENFFRKSKDYCELSSCGAVAVLRSALKSKFYTKDYKKDILNIYTVG